MPIDLTDDPTTFPGPIAGPAGGELRNSASVRTALQQLANRTANLRQPAADVTKKYPLASRSFSRIQTIASPGDGQFRKQSDGSWVDNDMLGVLVYSLHLPDGCLLTSLDVKLQGSGHGADQPVVSPQFVLFRTPWSTGVPENIYNFSAVATSGANYDTLRTLTFQLIYTGIGPYDVSQVIDNDAYHYTVFIQGEGGDHALPAGLTVWGLRADITVTSQDPGAA